MVGRPRKEQRKIREAIYFEPELHAWLKERAKERKCTISVLMNVIVDEKRRAEICTGTNPSNGRS